MSRPSSSWKASRRTRRSRRSSTRPKYPRRDSLHPTGAVARRGARARARGEARKPVRAPPARGGGRRGGGFVLDSGGRGGLGLGRGRIALRGGGAVYPPLVTVRLQASLARAQRRREQGITPLRR